MNPILQALQFAGQVFDTPGSIARGVLAGDPSAAFGGILDPEQRVSGRRMLESWGALSPKDEGAGFDLGDVAGFGAELATDPLTLLGAAGAIRHAGDLAEAGRAFGRGAGGLLTGEAGSAPLEAAALSPSWYYSRLRQAAEGLPGREFNSNALLNQLRKAPGGFSQEEAAFAGLPEFLAGRPTVNKSDLLNLLDQNALNVDRKLYGAPYEHAPAARPAIFGDYATPGGDAYRESLLTLRRPASAAEPVSIGQNLDGAYVITGAEDLGEFPSIDQAKAAVGQLVQQGRQADSAFRSSHFPEPDILAHIRTTDRTLPSGEKALLLDEIQSDWHQAGKQAGYLKPTDEGYLAAGWQPHAGGGPVQDAPFKDTWHELALKQAIDDAVKGGYSRILLNTGEGIRRLVGGGEAGQSQFYDRVLPGFLQKYLKKWNAPLEPIELTNSIPFESVRVPLLDRAIAGAKDDAVAEALTGIKRRMMQDAATPTEAMDQLASFMPKGTLQQAREHLDQYLNEPITYPSFRVNDAMKRDIMTRGQPLLSAALPVGLLAGGAAAAAARNRLLDLLQQPGQQA